MYPAIRSRPAPGTSRGVSLLELLFAVALFAFVLLLVFWSFEYGTRSFHRANSQQGIQGDAIRAAVSMQDEIKRSAVASVQVENRTVGPVDGQNVSRDGICVVGLRSWSTDYNPEGMPNWNRYIVFYATRDVPAGRLVRVLVDPSAPPGSPGPLSGFGPDLLNDTPSLNSYDGDAPPFTVLAENVLAFDAEDRLDGSVRIELKLKERGTANPTGAVRKDLTYETELLIFPQNTYPGE
ncbi:MAG: prepilin-type N-terminal cleavage/methylation domain-containing protein [Armatimonadetes bacterium]|nr:prepilin-type N-terminal cleavage/methylation domain-containing protein [Armatimonadota bacterium]